jgi:hypothetical protein
MGKDAFEQRNLVVQIARNSTIIRIIPGSHLQGNFGMKKKRNGQVGLIILFIALRMVLVIEKGRVGVSNLNKDYVYGWYYYQDGMGVEFSYPVDTRNDLSQDGIYVTIEI